MKLLPRLADKRCQPELSWRGQGVNSVKSMSGSIPLSLCVRTVVQHRKSCIWSFKPVLMVLHKTKPKNTPPKNPPKGNWSVRAVPACAGAVKWSSRETYWLLAVSLPSTYLSFLLLTSFSPCPSSLLNVPPLCQGDRHDAESSLWLPEAQVWWEVRNPVLFVLFPPCVTNIFKKLLLLLFF